MNGQIEIQKVLQTKLVEMQKHNPRFSLRAYAKRIGLNPGALSSILNGKRAISRSMALRIAKKLMLDPQETSKLTRAFQKKKGSDQSHNLDFLRITSAQFRVLTEWEHFAILSLMNTSNFQSDSPWISSRLGISISQTNQAIERLLSLGLIIRSSSAKLTRAKIGIRTSDDVSDISIRRFHDQNLDLAKDSLHRDSIEIRDFSATTFAIDPTKIPEAKAIIRNCQDELAALLESGKQSEVYRFSCQLFPLTVVESKLTI